MAVQTAAQLNQQSSPEGYLTPYRQNLHDTATRLTDNRTLTTNNSVSIPNSNGSPGTATCTFIAGENILQGTVTVVLPAGFSNTSLSGQTIYYGDTTPNNGIFDFTPLPADINFYGLLTNSQGLSMGQFIAVNQTSNHLNLEIATYTNIPASLTTYYQFLLVNPLTS